VTLTAEERAPTGSPPGNPLNAYGEVIEPVKAAMAGPIAFSAPRAVGVSGAATDWLRMEHLPIGEFQNREFYETATWLLMY